MNYFTFKSQIRIAFIALTLIICAESNAQLKLIHYWDMNNTLPLGGGGGTKLSPLNAEYSTFSAGSAYLSFGVPASSYTLDNGSGGATLNEFHPNTTIIQDTVAPQGNYYIRARSPNTGVPFYWYLPTTNYENITVSFASELSSAGKGVLSFSYSTNGGTTYSVIPTSCMTPANNPYTPGTTWGKLTINLSSLPAVNNNPNFIIAMTNTVVGATGNYRFDNIAVQGDTVQVSAQNTSCFGAGSAVATPVYGTAPYTYTWAPSGGNAATATGLSAGNYTVSMTDANGIVATATVAVVIPSSPLAASISSFTNVNCFNGNTGAAIASVSGGTSGYTYTWSPSGGNTTTASGLIQGTYTLNVTDANACTTNTTVTITQPTAALSAVITSTNVDCFGNSTGSANATANGGTAGYTYSWSPSGGNAATASGLAQGTYTLNITDVNACTTNTTVTITQPAALNVVITSTNVNCFGNSTGIATASISGGTAGYTYTWSPSGGNTTTASGLAQGTYTLSIADANACTTNTTVTITQPTAAVIASITASSSVTCFGLSNGAAMVTATGGTSPYTYSWNNGETSATATGLSATNNLKLIHYWDMNNTLPGPVVSGTTTTYGSGGINLSPLNAEYSTLTAGSAYLSFGGASSASYTLDNGPSGSTLNEFHVLGQDSNSAAAGNLYIRARSPNTGVPFYWHLPTTNYQNITVSFASELSSANKGVLSYSYSTNGGTTYSVIPTSCMTPATNPYTPGTTWGKSIINFSSIPGVNNNPNFIIAMTNTVVGATGNYRFDNIAVQGDTITGGPTYIATVTDANGCSNSVSVTITQPAMPLTASITTVANGGICSGGSVNATVTATGGTAGYTYTWFPTGGNSATTNSLTAGNYTVNVTDANNCTANSVLTVIAPASALSVSIGSFSNINCTTNNTGSVTAVVSGGASAYTYTWSPSGGNAASATNLGVGTYTINVTDANSCTTNTTVTITQPVVSVSSSTNVNCFGNNTGAASATVNGGTAGYTYTWSPSGGNTANASGLIGGTYTISVTDANSCTTNTIVTITQPTASLSVAITSTNVNCFGNNTGSATAMVSGGTTPYTYTWSPTGGNTATASSLLQGSYTLNVTDAKNCTTNTVVTITQPASALSASISSFTNVNCFGNNTGAATATVSGGTSGYTYSWSPTGGSAATGSNLIAGTYTVNVADANGCTTNTMVTITQPVSTLNAIITSTNVNCFGNSTGVATATVSGGTAGYTYTWSPTGGNSATASGLMQGTYTLNATDATGCTTNTAVTITQPAAALSANISASTNVICNGGSNGSATVAVTGGTAGYTYTWSPTGGNTKIANNLSQGTYTVNVTDANGCTTNTTVAITQPATAVTASIIASNNVTCFGLSNGTATVAATGGTGTYTYSWSNGQTSPSASGLSATSALKLIYYWDMNTTTPLGGAGLINQSPLASEYPTSGRTAYLVFNNGSNSILDNGAAGGTGSTLNEFPVLGNDTAGTSANNYFVRVRNPSYNVPFNWYMPTTNYKNIKLSYAAELSSAGKTISAYAYSLDSGLTFQNTGILVNGVPATSYTPSATWATVTIDLSSIQGANNNPKFVFQVLNTLPTATTTSGNSRFDNIALQGDTITAGPTYVATVTDGNGCANTASVTITQPPVLMASVSSSTNVNCFNGNTGSATASVSGGNTSYTYTWSPLGGNAATGSDLTAGNYTVNVTDNKGCTASNTVTITQPTTAVTVSITAQTNEQCNGGSNATATAIVAGGTPAYTYTWSPTGGNTVVGSSLLAGTYTLNVTDNKGCPASTTVTITQPNVMTASVSTFTNVNCNVASNGAATALAIGGSGNYSYQWDDGNNQTTATAVGLSSGVYDCFVTDATCNTQATATVNITQPNLMTVQLVGTTSVACHGSSTGNATVIATSGSGSYSYQWNDVNNQTTATAINLAGGSYTCVVTDLTCGTVVSKKVTIAQPATALSAAITSTNVACFDGTTGKATAIVTGGTSEYTYTWSPTGGNAATASGLTQGTYTLNVTDAHGCITNTVVTITQPTAALNAVVTSTNVNCFGNSTGVAAATVSGGTSGYTYTWSPSGGNTTTASNLTQGTYTLNVTDANGCNTNIMVTISQPSAPLSASVTASTNVICNGNNTGTATVLASGGTGNYSYQWNDEDNQTTATATNLIAGTYSCIVTDVTCSMFVTDSVTITQPASSPTITIAGANAICLGASTTFTASGVSTYTWTSGPTTAIYSVNPTTTTNYSVVGTNSVGCISGVAAVTLTVNNLPNITIDGVNSSTVTVCENTSGTLTANGGSTYTWSPGNSNATSITDSLTSTITFTLTGTDVNGCVNSATELINVNPLPTLNINSPAICIGSTASLTASGATSYTWNTGSTDATITDSPLINTNYAVSGTDGNNCINTATTSVIVNSLPGITVTPQTICPSATATLVANPTTLVSYTWSPGLSSTSGDVVTGNPTSNTSYSVWATDANGCIGTATTSISVVSSLTVSAIATNTAVCGVGDSTILSGLGASSYSWTSSGGTMSGTTGTNITVIPSGTSTTYTVVGSSGSCTASPYILTVNVNALPTVNVNSATVCAGTTATLTASGAITYTWNTNAIGGNINPSPTVTTNYTVTGTDGNNCTNTATSIITVNNLPTITITASSATVCAGNVTTLTASGAITYTWSNTGIIGTSITPSPTVTTNYTVTGTDINNCTDSDTLSIIVNDCTTDIIAAQYSNDGKIDIYPNPTNGAFTIEFVNYDCKAVKVFDEMGREVYAQSINGSSNNNLLKIDFSDLPNMNGMLTIQIITTSGVINKKVIVQK